MARSLHKVQKQIAKKRGAKPSALHENSRDARRLRQAGAREEKLGRIMNAAARSNQKYVERVAWFQRALVDQEKLLNDQDVSRLVEEFIGREDEELAELKAAQRPGRPQSRAQEHITQRIENETKEFKAGFWMPEVRSKEALTKLQQWGGQWGGLNTLHFIRATKGVDIEPSSFPPKALS